MDARQKGDQAGSGASPTTTATDMSESSVRTATGDVTVVVEDLAGPDTVHPRVPVTPPADPFSVPEDADPPILPAVVHSGRFPGDQWVEQARPAPGSGWRRRLWRLTGGRYNPGPDAEELRLRNWMEHVRRPFGGTRMVAVVSTKGGVGKTTTTVNLGHALASVRGDRVVALDANPDAGSLGYRARSQTHATAEDLLAAIEGITSYADIRQYTSQAASNLEVVASSDDPRTNRRLGRPEYEQLLAILRNHYNLVLADCGTGILDAATRGIVQGCDQLVVVTGPSVDAARAVSYLLAWLREHGLDRLVSEAIVVVNAVRGGSRPVDIDAMVEHFQAQVRLVVTVPWDEELANGATVELDWLAPATRQAYVHLAAELINGFTSDNATGPATGSTI